MNKVKTLAMLALVALTLSACGGSGDSGELPVNANPDDAPGAAGACLIEEPECDDTGAPSGAEPLPPPSDGGTLSGGMVVDGGISVSEALVGDFGGVIAVRGFLFDDGSGPRLCDALAESFPPQCGGESLSVTGYEELIDVPLQSEQGVTWTDQTVTFLGEIIDGVLVVDPTVAG